MMEIQKIGIIGSGIMGSGIAQAAAQSGLEVVLMDKEDDYVRRGLEKIKERLEKRISEGKLQSSERGKTLSNITITTSLEDCKNADMIIEAVVENEEIKRQIFRELDVLCQEETVFTSNTSSISITKLAQATQRPGRMAGMHFMNPAHIMKLIEVVRGLRTSEETIGTLKAVAEKMGKVPVVVNDFPGFIASRVMMAMINDAIYCLQEGISSKEDIDSIMKLGAHHPMGPLELADLMGLDICLNILEVLHAGLGEKYKPSPLLRNMVAAGKLGKKNAEGFYEYKK
jgi:3-hydroxybutyryl-CoA dehydrogenase